MTVVEELRLSGVTIRIIRGDITESAADAIVNAANSYLQHGGGVAGAIVRKGGSIIQEESNEIGYVPVGGSVLTTAGRLKAKWIIHTVGPRWGAGDEQNKLKNSIRNTLSLAVEKGIESIAMPAISAGIFGFPKKLCADIIVGIVADFAKMGSSHLRQIDFYLMDEEIIDFFKDGLGKLKAGV